MSERMVSSGFSQDVVELLISRGMSLTHIAKFLGVTKSYVSRVKFGKRSLTLDHLAVLEMELGQCL